MDKVIAVAQCASHQGHVGDALMLSQDQWAAIRTLRERGVGKKAIARELGIDVKTVRSYLRRGGRQPYRRRSPVREVLEREHGEFLRRRVAEVNFSAQVLYQELSRRGYRGSYPTVMRWVRPRRLEQQRLEAATVRFETGPGRQAQVDWGSTGLVLAGQAVRAHLFVMTLGYSRRVFSRAYVNERLPALLDAHERAFAHFGGRTEELLYDNPKTIVLHRDAEGKHIEWNPVFRDFADCYGFVPRLCRPYRARTKGKVESGVKYVKRNALVGRAFTSWEHLNDWLLEWAVTIADPRVHGTTHERPCERFRGETLKPVPAGRALYRLQRHPLRTVASDCMVSYETNRYSVPWRLVGQAVEVAVISHQIQIFHRGMPVAEHPLNTGRHQIIRDAAHFRGLFRTDVAAKGQRPTLPNLLWTVATPEVEVRDLAVYEAVAAGGAR
jgi:transposase